MTSTPHQMSEPALARAFVRALLTGDRTTLVGLLAPRAHLHGAPSVRSAPGVLQAADSLLDESFWGGRLHDLMWLPAATSVAANSACYRALVLEEPEPREGDLHLFYDLASQQVHGVHHLKVPIRLDESTSRSRAGTGPVRAAASQRSRRAAPGRVTQVV